MPYRKKTYRRRFRKRNSSRKTIAKIAKQVVLKNASTKRWITPLTEQSLASSVGAVFDELSQIDFGTAQPNYRESPTIRPIGYNFKYLLYNNAAVPVGVRVVIYLADDGDMLEPVTDKLLLNSDGESTTLTAEDVGDLIRPINVYQVRVLYDKLHKIAGLGDGTGVEYTSGMSSRKLSGKRCFDDVVGDSQRSNLRVMFIVRSLDNDATASTVEATWSNQYMFKDF